MDGQHKIFNRAEYCHRNYILKLRVLSEQNALQVLIKNSPLYGTRNFWHKLWWNCQTKMLDIKILEALQYIACGLAYP